MLTLFTEWGNELYLDVVKQSKTDPGFKSVALQKFREYEKLLSEFLNDDTMTKRYKLDDSDKEGWEIYHKLMDAYTVYKKFK